VSTVEGVNDEIDICGLYSFVVSIVVRY
jgi:hypothetical protein